MRAAKRKAREGRRADVDGLLCAGLLHDSDGGIGDKDEEDDERLDKGGRPVLVGFEEGEGERDDGRAQENEDELVLELAEDKSQKRCWWLLWEDCGVVAGCQWAGGEGRASREGNGAQGQRGRTVETVRALMLLDLLRRESSRRTRAVKLDDRFGRPRPGLRDKEGGSASCTRARERSWTDEIQHDVKRLCRCGRWWLRSVSP